MKEYKKLMKALKLKDGKFYQDKHYDKNWKQSSHSLLFENLVHTHANNNNSTANGDCVECNCYDERDRR